MTLSTALWCPYCLVKFLVSNNISLKFFTTLDHCTDGELISDELAKEGLPVFVGPTLGSKSKAELRHKSFTTPGALYRAGLTVSIITDAPVIPLENLTMCAGLAANAGLPMDEAWRAITINPARQPGHRQPGGQPGAR